MTRYYGHYLPVASRRNVLHIYRDRRTHPLPLAAVPLAPVRAMQATVDYFSGWLAWAVAFGPVGDQTVESLTNDFRAAEYYLKQVYARSTAFKWLPPRKAATR